MESDSKPSLLERISHWLMREPEDREQLIELLHGAYENSLMDADALAMIEGVLQVSEMRVGEIMIRARRWTSSTSTIRPRSSSPS